MKQIEVKRKSNDELVYGNTYPDHIQAKIDSDIEKYKNDEFIIIIKDISKELKLKEIRKKRSLAYPSIAEQLDLIYHEGVDAWKLKIKQIKDKYKISE